MAKTFLGGKKLFLEARKCLRAKFGAPEGQRPRKEPKKFKYIYIYLYIYIFVFPIILYLGPPPPTTPPGPRAKSTVFYWFLKDFRICATTAVRMAPGWLPWAPRGVPRPLRSLPRAPKKAPGDSQAGSRRPPGTPKTAQEGPRGLPRPLKRA